MNTEMNIWNVKFEDIIYNSSGPLCTTWDHLEALWNSSSSAIMIKSCSPEPRDGNPTPRYVETDLGSINSMWLPNLWYKQYIDYIPKLKASHKKPVVCSIVWFKPQDFLTLVEEFQQNSEVDMLEVNLSCPNVIGKPQIAYDFEASEELIKKIYAIPGDKPVGLKLPPYFDPIHVDAMAEIILRYDIAFVTCINSVGNTLIIDPETEQPLIKPKGWLGGLGWDYIKPIALANVRWFYKRIGHKTKIIGCGGIKSWVDVFEHFLAGASMVQLGTILAKEWPDCFERISREFQEYMDQKWYTDLGQIIGNLKEL